MATNPNHKPIVRRLAQQIAAGKIVVIPPGAPYLADVIEELKQFQGKL